MPDSEDIKYEFRVVSSVKLLTVSDTVMTIADVKAIIQAEVAGRDVLFEHSPANFKLLSKYFGTFQAVLSGKGSEKYLIPELGTVHFLYRGQNKEIVPCLPTLYRGEPDDVAVFEHRLRLTVFKRLLATHPVVDKFFNRHHFVVHQEGLAQHYGLKTEILDLTSNLDVALFFAVCKYNPNDDTYDYYRDGEHTGVLYVFDPIYDNEPCPGGFDKYLSGNIRPIGLQAFPRPGAQCGYGLRISKGESTKSWMFEFKFTAEESKSYFERFGKGNVLWLKDRLVSKTNEIAQTTEFSYDVFNETFRTFRPSGWSGTRMKQALRSVHLKTNVPDFTFPRTELSEITEEWNDHLGREMASKILRKPWFRFDGKEKDENGQDKIVGIRNRMDFNTIQHMGESIVPLFVGSPAKFEGAVWKNYTGKPCPSSHFKSDNTWHKIDASMTNFFGQSYLTEADWRIV